MATNVAGMNILGWMKMAPESIIETQNAVVQGMRVAATKSASEFDIMTSKLHQAMAKADPGGALLASMQKAVNALQKDPSLKGLETRFDGLVRKAIQLGDVGAQYIAGSGLNIARQAQGREPGQFDFQAFKQFGEVTTKAFTDIRTSSQDLILALKTLKTVQERDAGMSPRQLMEQRDPDGRSLYMTNRRLYLQLKRQDQDQSSADMAEYGNIRTSPRERAMAYRLMRKLGQEEAFDGSSSSFDPNAAKQFRPSTSLRERTANEQASGVLLRKLATEEALEGSSSQIDLRAAQQFGSSRNNRDALANRIASLSRLEDLTGGMSPHSRSGDYGGRDLDYRLKSASGDGNGQAASFWDRYSFDSDMSSNQRRRQNASIQRDIHKENVRTGQYMPGHNFRFASQNIGFGIDDAIQSYHYGGVGASIRAASNNITAVAGMTIPNPMIAAATVVGLSVATAALPTILRKLGLDEDKEKAEGMAADSNYKRDGSTSGGIRRRTAGMSALSSQINSFHKISDFNNAQDLLAGQATAYFKDLGLSDYQIEHLKDEGHLGRDTLINRGGNYRQVKDYDAKMEFLTKYQQQYSVRKNSYEESVAHMQLLGQNLPDVLRGQERQRVQDEAFDNRLHNATSVTEYNNILNTRRDTEIHRIMQDPNMSGQDKAAELIRVRGEYYDSASKKQGIMDTVRDNAIRRKTFIEDQRTAAFGGQSSVEAMTQASQRRMEAIQNDRSIAPADKQILYTNEQAGLTRQLGMADFANKMSVSHIERASMGYTGSLGNLFLSAQQRGHDIENNLNLDDVDRRFLLHKNNVGFSNQREEMMLNMVASGRINSPLGHLYDSIRQRGTQMSSDFAEGFTSPEEQQTLTSNFKTLVKKQLRDAHTPSGTERFIADAMTVGSAADRELQFKALGNFSEIVKGGDIDKLSLDQLVIIAKELSDVNSKLEIARSHL